MGASVSPSQYDEDGDYYCISMATVKKYYFDKNDAQKVSVAYSNENLNKSVEVNDIIMTRSGMAIGNPTIGDSNDRAVVPKSGVLNHHRMVFRKMIFEHGVSKPH